MSKTITARAGGRSSRRKRAWLATAALCAAVAGAPAPGQAQTKTSRQVAATFDIPAQDLGAALTLFSDRAGLRLLLPSSVVGGKKSTAVSGRLTREQALGRLLAGTGLTYRFPDADTVTIVDPSAVGVTEGVNDGSTRLDTILVEGGAENAWGAVDGIVARQSATGTKSDTPILETPQTVNVVAREELDKRGATTVSEALTYTPGAYANVPHDLRNDTVSLRGFFADESRYLDGLISSANEPVEAYGLERVEVLKGPASVLYGQGEPGGIVSQISKRPKDEPFGEIQLQQGNPKNLSGALDFGGLLDPEGVLTYRLTGLYRDRDSQVDFTSGKRLYIAPSLTWRPTDSTALTVLMQHQEDRIDGYTYFFLPLQGTLYPNPNGQISPHAFFGEPGFDHWDTTRTKLGYSFEHEFENNWKIRQNFAYTRTSYSQMNSFLEGLDPVDLRTLNRSIYGNTGLMHDIAIDTHIQGEFETGPIGHTLLMGIDHHWRTDDQQAVGGTMDPIDIVNPVYGRTGFDYDLTQDLKETIRQTGIYVQDQAKWGGWIFNLAGRYDIARQETTGYFYGGRLNERSDENVFTWKAGIGHVFDNGVMPYFSYATSFKPEVGTDRSGNLFEASQGDQYEIGIKYQPDGFDGMFTISAFDLRKTNLTTWDPADVNFSVQTGEVRIRGLEAEAKVSPVAGLDLIAGYTFNNAEITKNNPDPWVPGNPTYIGNRPEGIPEHQVSAWADYTFQSGALEGLGMGAGIRYIGSRYGDQANTVKIPHVTLVDAALRYDFKHIDPAMAGLNLSVNATNLFNKTYISGCSGTYACYYGNSRTVTATLTYKW